MHNAQLKSRKSKDEAEALAAMRIAYATHQKTYCPVLVFRVPNTLHNVFD